MEQTIVKTISSQDLPMNIDSQSVEKHARNGANMPPRAFNTSSSSKKRPTPPLPVELIRPPVNRHSEEIITSK